MRLFRYGTVRPFCLRFVWEEGVGRERGIFFDLGAMFYSKNICQKNTVLEQTQQFLIMYKIWYGETKKTLENFFCVVGNQTEIMGKSDAFFEWQLDQAPNRFWILLVMSIGEELLGLFLIDKIFSEDAYIFVITVLFLLYLFVMIVASGMAVVTLNKTSYRAYRTAHYRQYQMICVGFILRLIVFTSLCTTLLIKRTMMYPKLTTGPVTLEIPIPPFVEGRVR